MLGSARVPKYQIVYQALLDSIHSGKYPPGTRLPPETELPAQVGASLQTTRQALQELVRNGFLVRRRGDGTYVSDRRHPPLIEGRSLHLGVLLPFPVETIGGGKSFEWRVVEGTLSEWDLAGEEPAFTTRGHYELTRATWRQPSRGLTVEVIGEAGVTVERHPPVDEIAEGRFDGLITVGIIEAEFFRQLMELRIPLVIMDFPSSPYGARADHVFADPTDGYGQAVRRFAEQGLRRIHFVGMRKWLPAPPGVSVKEWMRKRTQTRVDPDSFLRLNAYRQAMDTSGLAVDERWVHYCQSGTRYEEDLAEKLARLPGREQPEVLICHDLALAERLMRCLANRSVQVQAAGACSRWQFSEAYPIVLDGVEMGRVAADLLLTRLQRPRRPFLNVGVRMTFDRKESQENLR